MEKLCSPQSVAATLSNEVDLQSSGNSQLELISKQLLRNHNIIKISLDLLWQQIKFVVTTPVRTFFVPSDRHNSISQNVRIFRSKCIGKSQSSHVSSAVLWDFFRIHFEQKRPRSSDCFLAKGFNAF
ncbi:hypothetical protein MAR_004402 [Mya arenaria]|uniref:Uncharacterized protein n=1 Tax=Mya arenaria TaxID=6604 RepID=A0ABY7EYB0_MYAAR|nr:hypothetical protein MAR_004402 [Mya arenaria]